MSARTRRSAAIGIVVAVTTGTALLLTGCEHSVSARPTPAPANSSTADATPSHSTPQAPPPPLNGTAHNGLTISNGTRTVVMNGTTVDFGTVVRDLAWSPDGKKAAFVDGNGDLVVSDPDGTGRTVVARNPGGQTWSHPAWQVTGVDGLEHIPPKNFLFFTAAKGGTTRLEKVAATGGTPEELSLNSPAGDNPSALPTTGNIWPNTGGTHGTAVYANTDTGQVYIRDDYLRQQGDVLTPGSQPALSPDEREIVFVRSVDGHDHLFLDNLEKSSIKDLTPNATTDYTEPAWSPDGRTIAVRTPAGIDTLPPWGYLPAPLGAGGGSAAPTQVAGYTGLPAYRP